MGGSMGQLSGKSLVKPCLSLDERVIPDSQEEVDIIAKRCKAMVTKKALVSAGLSVVPLPGVNVAVDISLMISILDSINKEFGLSPKQIDKLSSEQQLKLFQWITASGSAFAGKLITQPLLMAVLKKVSIQLTSAQAAKIVPIIGIAASAGISFAALKWIGNTHIKDCVKIVQNFNEEGIERSVE